MGRDACRTRSSARRRRAIPDTGETYYRHWLNALERLVAEKGVTDAATLARYQHAWDHAADRTPHGEPIELQPQDFHHTTQNNKGRNA